MDLMEVHDLADIRPNIGLGNASCGYAYYLEVYDMRRR